MKKISKILLLVFIAVGIALPIAKVNATGATTNIYVVWNCGGNVCVSDAISVNNGVEVGGVKTYETNYIKASDVVDSTNNQTINPNAVSNLNGGITNWYIYESVPSDIRTKTWAQLDTAIHEDGYDMGIDPTGGKDGFNSLAHNGDRNYRVVIYNDALYESLTFDVDPTNYTYYLGDWDPVFTNPTIDISSTTKNKPAVYTTYLLENTLKFKSGTVNKEAITSVRALDVPNKALTITKTDGIYTVRFNSNYYSNVVFELTGASGTKYYLRVDRSFIFLYNNLGSRPATPTAYVKFVYPDTKAYSDYDVIANITKSNGSVVTRKLEAFALSDYDNLNPGPPVAKMVWTSGVKLKGTGYAIELTSDTVSVELTVTNKNATLNNTYGGTFGGHDKGVSLDSEAIRRIIESYSV